MVSTFPVYQKYFRHKNSFCIQSKYYVKIASDFAPASWRKNPPSRRRRDSKFVWKNGGKSVGRASRVPPSGFFKTFKFYSGVFIVPSSHLFSKQMMSHAPPPPRGLGGHRKKTLLTFLILRAENSF